MDGGTSVGNVCKAFAYHGYNGIERETVDAIKIPGCRESRDHLRREPSRFALLSHYNTNRGCDGVEGYANACN